VNVKLEAALAYSRMHWRIFPCYSIIEGRCSCGKPDCGSAAKHPRTKGGFKDATDDETTIRRWWTTWPHANIALATGSGIVVFDIDGQEGKDEFKALVAAHGASPATLASQTGRGAHLFYHARPDSPEVRSSAVGKVHVRGEGGYVILPPSNHISGNEYKWLAKNPIAVLPEWMRKWSQGYEITNTSNRIQRDSTFENIGALPAYLQAEQKDITQSASEALKTVWSPAEQSRLISALSIIPADNYETWYQVGMALQGLGWGRSDGSDLGFQIFDEWSQTCPAKYALGTCEAKWASFERSARGELGIGTIYHLAQQRGWNGGAPKPKPLNGRVNGVNSSTALPAVFLSAFQGAIHFPDVTEEGKIRATMTNTKVAIIAFALDCKYDLFHNRMLVAGEAISTWNSSELSDHVITMVRDLIRYRFGFDPTKACTQDACETLCLQRRYDPVLDYLDSLRWDGQPRLDHWLTSYMQAADSDYIRAVARLSLIAAVRRARIPGTKYDQIIVLEGLQGKGKSEALEILAGADNFSDQSILGVDDRKQQELTEGVWLYEISELSGMRRAEIEHVKAFASRKKDRARPAYGRYMVTQPRRTVFFASTNKGEYLQDDTGNRRFWPVATENIDLAGLRRDRDQLWAEASERERLGESHFLPESLWKIAGEHQDERMQGDDWLEPIAKYLAEKHRTDVSALEVLCDNQYIQQRPDAMTIGDAMRVSAILKRLNYKKYKKRIGDATANRWHKITKE